LFLNKLLISSWIRSNLQRQEAEGYTLNREKVGQQAGSCSVKGSEKGRIDRLIDERENNLAYLNSIKGHTSAKSNVFI
jgi:hypothetical protein